MHKARIGAALLAILAAAALLLVVLWLWRCGIQKASVTVFGTLADADAILLKEGEHAVLIDTGEEAEASKLIDQLSKEGVQKIDALILTHPDKDHIGGARAVVQSFPVAQVFVSPYEKGSALQEGLEKTLSDLGIPVRVPREAQIVSCGSLEMTLYPPLDTYEESNDSSLLVYAKHGEVSMLFAGDAEKKRLKEALAIPFGPVDLYKVAHHGRGGKNAAEFAQKLCPRYAVVTAQNVEESLARVFSGMGTEVYVTVPEHTVRFESDGRTLAALEEEQASQSAGEAA